MNMEIWSFDWISLENSETIFRKLRSSNSLKREINISFDVNQVQELKKGFKTGEIETEKWVLILAQCIHLVLLPSE